MARATRIALDLALVSLRAIGPVVSNIWSATKGLLVNTPVKPLVCNPLVRKAESAMNQIGAMLVSKIITLRDRQLPLEVKYLEKELEKVKKKMDQKAASKALRPKCAIAWRYANVEMIPPNTKNFFHGTAGNKLEEAVSKFADTIIAGLEGRIREIEAEKENQRKAKEAAIKAAHDRATAEAKKKEEQKLKEEAIKKALEAKQAKEKAEKLAKKAEVKAEAKTDAQSEKPQRNKAKKVKKREITKCKRGPKGKK